MTDEFDRIVKLAAAEDSCPADLRQLLVEAPRVPGETTTGFTRPSWFNHDLYTRGQLCFRANTLALVVAHLIGLLHILHVPTIVSVLQHTRQSGDTWRSFKRYLETLSMLLGWYDGDIFSGECEAGRRIETVVQRHNRAFRRHSTLATTSQLDMVLTQWAFCAHFLLHPAAVSGLALTEHDCDALTHFWRCVGHRLGIPDRFNLCRDSADQCRRRCRFLARHVITPIVLLHSGTGTDSVRHSLCSGSSCTSCNSCPPCPHQMTSTMLSGVALIVPLCDQLAFRCRALSLLLVGGATDDDDDSTTIRSAICAAAAQLPLHSHCLHALLSAYCRRTGQLHSWTGGALRTLARALLLAAVACCRRVPAVPWANMHVTRAVTHCWLCVTQTVDDWLRKFVQLVATSGGENAKPTLHSRAETPRAPLHPADAEWQAQVCRHIMRVTNVGSILALRNAQC